MQYVDDVLLSCTLEICMVLLSNVTPINSIETYVHSSYKYYLEVYNHCIWDKSFAGRATTRLVSWGWCRNCVSLWSIRKSWWPSSRIIWNVGCLRFHNTQIKILASVGRRGIETLWSCAFSAVQTDWNKTVILTLMRQNHHERLFEHNSLQPTSGVSDSVGLRRGLSIYISNKWPGACWGCWPGTAFEKHWIRIILP